jgi:Flp pilus assembly protein TadD
MAASLRTDARSSTPLARQTLAGSVKREHDDGARVAVKEVSMRRPAHRLASSVTRPASSRRDAVEPDPAPASSSTAPGPGLVWHVTLWGAVAVLGGSIALACVGRPSPLPPVTDRVFGVVNAGRQAASAAPRQDLPGDAATAHVPAAPPTFAPAPSLLQQLALPTTPDDVVAHRAEGEALLRAGRASDAVIALRRALARDGSAAVWGLLGDAHLRAGATAAGVACLEEAVALDVDDEALRRLLAHQYLSQSDGAHARLHAEEWVRLSPQDPTARQALGRAYSQLGVWRQAIDQFTLVAAVQPDNAWAHNNLGYAALQLGDTTTAVEHLERAVDGRPLQASMFNNLGVAYERAGHVAFAHAAFSRAAELSPRYASAALNRDRVQKILDESSRVVAAARLVRFRDDVAVDGSAMKDDTARAPPARATSDDGLYLPPMPDTASE